MARCYEVKLDMGPFEIGRIPNEENHMLCWHFQNLYAMGPNMFTSGKFTMNLEYPKVGYYQNTQWDKLPYMNTNLQLLCIIKSDHMLVSCGIHFDIKNEKNKILPVIRVKQCSDEVKVKTFKKKNKKIGKTYKLKRETYPRKHKQPVMVMIAFNDCRTLLTFGLDYYMYAYVLMEDSRMGDYTGELECVDEWFIKDQPVTCAKVTRGGRYLIVGTFRGTVLIIDPNKKEVLTLFEMKYQIPVNSVEEGFNDPDDSCIYAIGDVHASIQKFMLTEEYYDRIYGGIQWEVAKDSSEYKRRNRKYTASINLLTKVENFKIEEYKDKLERDAVVLRKFTSDRK